MTTQTTKTTSILIIGSGFAGLGMAIRLKQAGIDDFVLLEQAGDVGGTWRDNDYPGAACDVPSHLYSFSFEPNPEWTRQFAPQREIFAYLRACAVKYGVLPHIRFDSAVARAVFDERAGRWDVTTRDGKTYRTHVLVSGSGGLSRPSLPDIPGLADFQGKTFHSARWDHGFALDGKTVAVVGTGASAIQIVPAIAPKVGRLHLFQRTPPWVIPKEDRDITERERGLFRRIPLFQDLARKAIFLGLEWRAAAFVLEPRILKLAQSQVLRYLAHQVPDRALRKKLTPSYTLGCKRILLSNDYYESLQRPNVDVVTDGIARVRAHSIVTTDGTERAVDAIVLATGFQAAEGVAPFEVRGIGGVDLDEAWREGAEAYLGTSVSGFPNFFFIVGPNTGLGHSSMVFMIESQIAYILSAIKTMRARGLRSVDVRRDLQRRYNARLHTRLDRTVWAKGGCVSWYNTRTGKNTTLWPGFTIEFRLRTRRFDPSCYELVVEDRARSVDAERRARATHDVAAPATSSASSDLR